MPRGLDARVSLGERAWVASSGGVVVVGVKVIAVGGEVSATEGCFGFIQLREREMAAEMKGHYDDDDDDD